MEGYTTKQYIKIILAVALTIVLAVTAVMIGPHIAGKTNPNTPVSTARINTPAMSDTLLDGQRVAISPDEEQKPVSSAPADKSKENTPSYNAGNIPAVTGLTRLEEESDGITLSWDDIPGITSYRVYRCNLDAGGNYSLFTTVNNPGLKIRKLNAGSLYGFKVAAIINGGAHEGAAAEAKFATTPVQVKGFKLSDQTSDATTIKWEQNDRADGYVLERCYNGEWSEYQTFPRETTEFTDTGLNGGKAYYYRISAYRDDSTGKLRGKPTELYTVAGLLGPKDDGSSSKLGRVSLDYKASAFADGYLIYNSKDKKKWTKLTDTSRTHYASTRLEDGVTYYFRIYAYREVSGHKIRGGYTELKFVADMEIFDKAVGDTYVEVNLNAQHIWYIVDGDVYLESDCVTGNYGSADTPEGFHEVNDKMSPCVLEAEDYRTEVTYWMPFIGGGWGLHDASWRSSFGGDIYKGDGSHGCVNLPYDVAEKLYHHIEVGTPVIVYS